MILIVIRNYFSEKRLSRPLRAILHIEMRKKDREEEEEIRGAVFCPATD